MKWILLLITFSFSSEFKPKYTKYKVLHQFLKEEGIYPIGSLIVSKSGSMYGTCPRGGVFGKGTIFKYTPKAKSIKVLRNFQDEDGTIPLGSLFLDEKGVLFGSCTKGTKVKSKMKLGTIFSLDTNGNSFKVLKSFELDFFAEPTNEGLLPVGNLIPGKDSYLYGMCMKGGTGVSRNDRDKSGDLKVSSIAYHESGIMSINGFGQGTIFRLKKDGTSFELLHSFQETEGQNPYGSLIQDSDGNLYGICSQEGKNNHGSIFRYNPINKELKVIKQLSWDTTGAHPIGSLIEGSNDVLFGMCYKGGTGGEGTIFSVNKNGSNFRVLHNFSHESGCNPTGSLISKDNLLYGLCSHGGINDAGTLFKIKEDGSAFDLVYNFIKEKGGYPNGDITLGNDGNLYALCSDTERTELTHFYRYDKKGLSYNSTCTYGKKNINTNLKGTLISIRLK